MLKGVYVKFPLKKNNYASSETFREISCIIEKNITEKDFLIKIPFTL